MIYTPDKRILFQMFEIPLVHLTDHIKFNKKESQSMDASVLLRKGTKIIMRCRGREGPGWKRGGGKKIQGAESIIGEREERSPEG